MNEELLKEVARCAPAEWRVQHSGYNLYWSGPTGEYGRSFPEPQEYINPCMLKLCDDMGSSAAIVAMLDAMEREGFEPVLARRLHTGYVCSAHPRVAGQDPFIARGDTRAEAVAKAFVEVFKK